MKYEYIPGTNMVYTGENLAAFSYISPLITATGGLLLSQIISITGLESSAIQNWVKRGWVPNPVNKKYNESSVGRILIINALRECMQLEKIHKLMGYLNGEVNDRSDDIIKDSELFNYLCEVIKSVDIEKGISEKSINEVLKKVLSDFNEVIPCSKKRITETLNVMTHAYVTGVLKRKTDLLFSELF